MIAPVHILNATSISAEHLHPCLKDVGDVLGVSVHLTASPPHLEKSFDRSRAQYHSTAILNQIVRLPFASNDRVIAIVDVDLYIPVLTFVFGEAQLNGRAAVVSTYRLSNQFYGFPENHNLMLQRLTKEMIHELGHCFGLLHCRDFECVMRSSTYVEEIDLKKSGFCMSCSSLLFPLPSFIT